MFLPLLEVPVFANGFSVVSTLRDSLRPSSGTPSRPPVSASTAVSPGTGHDPSSVPCRLSSVTPEVRVGERCSIPGSVSNVKGVFSPSGFEVEVFECTLTTFCGRRSRTNLNTLNPTNERRRICITSRQPLGPLVRFWRFERKGRKGGYNTYTTGTRDEISLECGIYRGGK